MRFSGNLFVQLPQRSDVVENPERAAVRSDDQVVAMNRQVAHGSMRQVKLQRLPVIAVIERNEYAALGSREQQSLAHRIFAHYVHRSVIGKAGDNFLPTFAEVVRAVDV